MDKEALRRLKFWLPAGAVLFFIFVAKGNINLFIWNLQRLIFYLIVIAGAVWLYTRMRGGKRADAEKDSLEKLLSPFGSDGEARIAGINKAFDQRTQTLNFPLNFHGARWRQIIRCDIGRTLSGMPAKEREALRSVLLLYVAGLNVNTHNTWIQALGLIYGDGKGTIYAGWKYTWPGYEANDINEGVKWLIGRDGVEPSVNMALSELASAVEKNPAHPVIKPLKASLLGTGSMAEESGHLLAADILTFPGDALIVGKQASSDAMLLGYRGEGSLITVAPPRSGKTQCHVIPNLLNWRGPAVVLDIKGEIHDKTSSWRRQHVGPVYRFSPLDPDNSQFYNPLTAVSPLPDDIWEDSRFLSDMLITPGSSVKDPFWENSARDALTAAIAYVTHSRPRQDRTMSAVLDILHGLDWDKFIISLREARDVPAMVRVGRSLGDMESKTRDGVLKTALSWLGAWEGARITRSTARSDWTPLDLRKPECPTLYICINPNEIESYASLLRVVIAQHIRTLTAKLPEEGSKPILFVLDELPRLRHMPPVEEALEIGAQYGLRLWMFTQNIGQLENAYDNAQGMIGSCALRMFMNPSLQDGTAQKLSDDLGFRESIIDGQRVKRVEADVLAGPEYKDSIVIMAAGAAPVRAAKHYAHSDSELSTRMAVKAGQG